MAEGPSTETDARGRILSRAEELFGRRGYEAVSVADIAEASDVSTGLVYYHFKDKASLLSALVDEVSAMTGRLVEEHLERPAGPNDPSDPGGPGHPGDPHGPRRRIESFIRAYMRLIHERRDLVRLLARQVTDVDNPTGRAALGHMADTIERVAHVIAEGVECGDLDDVDPQLAAESIFGMLHIRVVAGALEAPHSAAIDSDPEHVAEFVSRVLMEGIGR